MKIVCRLLAFMVLVCGVIEAKGHRRIPMQNQPVIEEAVPFESALLSLSFHQATDFSLSSGVIPFTDVEVKSDNIQWSSQDHAITVLEEGIYSMEYFVQLKRNGGWSPGKPVQWYLRINGEGKLFSSLQLNDPDTIYHHSRKTLCKLSPGSSIQLLAEVENETNRVLSSMDEREAMARVMVVRIK